MAGTLPPLEELLPDNRGPLVIVTVFVSITTLVATVGARVVDFVRRKNKIGRDDVGMVVAMMFAITQGALVVRQTKTGLGRHWIKLSGSNQTAFLKLAYASQLLGTIAMALAKTSVIFLYQRITQLRPPYAYHVLYFLVGIWTLFSVFSQAFACGLPNPWYTVPPRCSAQYPLSYVIISLNAFTDAILAAAVIPVLWRLHMNKNRKYVSMGYFALRLVVSAAAIAQLVVLVKMPKSSDLTWVVVPKTILDQVVIYCSVIFTCLPRTQALLSIQTGQMGAAVSKQEMELSHHSKSTMERSSPDKIQVPKSLDSAKALFNVQPKPQRRSNSDSESSLCRPDESTKSCDENAITYAAPVPRDFRPPSEALMAYDCRCFSDANHGKDVHKPCSGS